MFVGTALDPELATVDSFNRYKAYQTSWEADTAAKARVVNFMMLKRLGEIFESDLEVVK
jgi:hypothetical protein